MRRTMVLAILILSILLLAVAAACVKIADTPTSAPSGNQPPVISSLTASQNQTYPEGPINLQAIVSDPDGDSLNYKWTASGGSFVEQGRGNTTWTAPKQYGDYEIKLMVDDGKGGSQEAVVTITVSANHPPEITSFTASPAALQFSSMTTLTVIASDPDGDTMQYKWDDAHAGTLSGVGNKVSWTSPSKNGNFTITVIVSDGKGAESRKELIIPVASVSGVQTINLVEKESGTVTSEGDKDTSYYKAGDDDKNIGYRAFFSFNIFPLMNQEIKEAKLKFIGGKVVGDDPFDPITGVGNFQIRHLSWPIGTLPKFNVEAGPVQRLELYGMNKPLVEVDVTPEITNVVANRLERFQVEATFTKRVTNGNNVAQFLQWTDVVLEVTSAPK
ncbi:MAG: PKD domain-containing protein [Dehalococcoidia bacterium]|nr:PKD domain-containing protein [Dehalococcoidia bacterium]